jgi:flagellar motor switch protein FliN/FliY
MSDEEKDAFAGKADLAAGKKAGETKQAGNVISEKDLQSLLTKAKGAGGGTVAPGGLDEVGSGKTTGPGASIDMLMDVSLNVRIELGRTRMSVEDILNLGGGSVVTLDKLAGDLVDVLVNDKLVARGEVLILNDRMCVRVAEIVSPEERQDASKA